MGMVHKRVMPPHSLGKFVSEILYRPPDGMLLAWVTRECFRQNWLSWVDFSGSWRMVMRRKVVSAALAATMMLAVAGSAAVPEAAAAGVGLKARICGFPQAALIFNC